MIRRGYYSRLTVPIYQNNNHSAEWSDLILNFIENKAIPTTGNCALLDHNIYGNGCACLRVTFQNSDVHESFYLHDQLVTVAPLMLALTAACPIFKGYMCETDCRWYIANYTFYDRTPEERKPKVCMPVCHVSWFEFYFENFISSAKGTSFASYSTKTAIRIHSEIHFRCTRTLQWCKHSLRRRGI